MTSPTNPNNGAGKSVILDNMKSRRFLCAICVKIMLIVFSSYLTFCLLNEQTSLINFDGLFFVE